MSVRGYILVETEVGRTQAVGRAMRDLVSELATVNAVDTVTGPYDVIVQLEAPRPRPARQVHHRGAPVRRRRAAHHYLPRRLPGVAALG